MMQIEKNRGGGFEEGPPPDVRIATYSNGLVGVALVGGRWSCKSGGRLVVVDRWWWRVGLRF